MIVDITFTAKASGMEHHEDEYAKWQILCFDGVCFTITERGCFGMYEPALRISDNWWR